MSLISWILFIFLMNSLPEPATIDFKNQSVNEYWYVVNDGVMGGVSTSTFNISKENTGIFEGRVSLENNGGFCSIRFKNAPIAVAKERKVRLKIKGDGKRYQFRVKANSRDYHSYITYFQTSGKWQTIELNLEDLYPAFRGRNLDLPNFQSDKVTELSFLIGNKKAEEFRLEIESIDFF